MITIDSEVPAWLPALLRPDEVARFDPNAFNAGRPELKGAWFGVSDAIDVEHDGVRYVARADGWPACPTCGEDELFGDAQGAYCMRCHAGATAAVVAMMVRLRTGGSL